jgi:hypothetical protein
MKTKPKPTVEKRRGSAVTRWDKNISPVGWYVASYVLRFVEMDWKDINDPEARFVTWENTILIKARNLDHAYTKTVAEARLHTRPYKGGKKGIDVQWIFEGVTEILPVYEKLEDRAEIMWAEHMPRKLKSIRRRVRKKGEFFQ